jgi:hypothetical protein
MGIIRNSFLYVFSALFFLGILCTETQASIVNINSLSNNESNPVNLTLQAGTYDVTPIGTAQGGAFNSWNAWNGGQVVGGDANGANCVVGWINNYFIYSQELSELFFSDGIRYKTSLLALDHAVGTTFTLVSDAIVSFYIKDGTNGSTAWDNRGGMSLNVTSTATPIPGAIWLLGSGLFGFIAFKRKLT